MLFHGDMRICEFVADRYGSLLLTKGDDYYEEQQKVAADVQAGFSYLWGNEIEGIRTKNGERHTPKTD